MKFKMYHPSFVTLDDEEEKKFQRWHEVETVDDCLKILRWNGLGVSDKSDFRIEGRYLMEYVDVADKGTPPHIVSYVRGFVE